MRIVLERGVHIPQVVFQGSVTTARVVQRFLILVIMIECQYTTTVGVISLWCQRLSPPDKQSKQYLYDLIDTVAL